MKSAHEQEMYLMQSEHEQAICRMNSDATTERHKITTKFKLAKAKIDAQRSHSVICHDHRRKMMEDRMQFGNDRKIHELAAKRMMERDKLTEQTKENGLRRLQEISQQKTRMQQKLQMKAITEGVGSPVVRQINFDDSDSETRSIVELLNTNEDASGHSDADAASVRSLSSSRLRSTVL